MSNSTFRSPYKPRPVNKAASMGMSYGPPEWWDPEHEKYMRPFMKPELPTTTQSPKLVSPPLSLTIENNVMSSGMSKGGMIAIGGALAAVLCGYFWMKQRNRDELVETVN